MTKTAWVIALALFATPSISSPRVANPQDIALVEAQIRHDLTVPGAIALSDIVSISDPISSGDLTYVCGNAARSREEGTLLSIAPFVAMLSNDPLSKQRTVNLLRIAEDDLQSEAARRICTEKERFVSQVNDAGTEVIEALRAFSSADLFCNAVGGEPCDQRQASIDRLQTLGWCHGGPSGPRSSDDWGPCEDRSK